jgi:hypothetical protein
MQGRLGPLLFVPAVAAALLATACDVDGDGADYAAVCTDRNGVRVDDSKCAHAPDTYTNDGFDSTDAFLWYYIGTSTGHTAPPIGGRAVAGTLRTPVTAQSTAGGGTRVATVQRGGVSTSGGSISRGGLGISGSSGGKSGGSGGS